MRRPESTPFWMQALISQRTMRAIVRRPRLSKLCPNQPSSILWACNLAAASVNQRKRLKAGRAHQCAPDRIGQPARRATDVLLLINTVCFAAQFLTNGKILVWGVKDNAAILAGQWWRLITPAFLHKGLMHFMVNTYSLNNVGPTVERLTGSSRFLAVYGLSAAAGCTLSYFGTPAYALGASGAIFGVLGSLTVFLLRHRKQLGPSVADATLRNLLRTFAINLVIGMSPGIDNWGHFGGFFGGSAAAFLLGPCYSMVGGSLYDRPPLGVLAFKPRTA